MPSKVKNKLAILSYHEKRIHLEQEVQQRFVGLDQNAQVIVRTVIREFIRRSAMPVRIIYAQKFVEELENKLLEQNQAFSKLSEIHKRTLAEHKGQLDYTWEEAYTKGMQDTNERHEAKFKELLQDKENLRSQINAQKSEPIMAELGSTLHMGFMVQNWRDSWKWISNWCFGLIVFFATTPIPPEVLMVLPENVRTYLIAWTAFCGFVGRYINQSKGVQTWSLKS